jgi:hypothetical protein
MSLSGAELRLLPYLATHLTYPEIGQRLYISRHTVKAEATSRFLTQRGHRPRRRGRAPGEHHLPTRAIFT